MKLMYVYLRWAVPLLFLSNIAFGQTIRLSGGIIDSVSGTPLPGAIILNLSQEIGTYSDNEGNFFLELESSNAQMDLEVRLLGYEKKIISFTPSSDIPYINILLKEDLLSVDEVVITGQGQSIGKRRLSTNVQVVSGNTLEGKPLQRLDQLLQSELTNVGINLTGGQPGTTSIIRTRGIVSAFNNSTPIIYVDGVRADNLNTAAVIGLVTSGNRHQGAATSALADIPVENIERVEFINGGAATTLYGSDAANGVIQIFTKRGGVGKAQVNFKVNAGAVTPTNDFLFFDRTADLLFQTGVLQQYTVGINGGNDQAGYSASASFFRNTGFRIHNQNENERVDVRTGIRANFGKNWTYNSSFGFVNNRFSRVRNGNAGGYTGTWFTEAGSSLFTGPGFNNNLDELSDAAFGEVQAYVDLAERLQHFQSETNRFQTSQIIEYRPITGLTIRGVAGVDYRVQQETGIVTNAYLNHTRATEPGSETTTEGTISNFDRNFLGLTFEGNAQYTIDFGDFSSISTVGGQLFRNEDRQVEFTGINVPDGATTIAVAATQTSDEFYTEVVNYGVYIQENFGYKNRYFLDVGVRGDGNSAFGDNIGIQYFPKVGISYVISDEPFIKDGISGNTLSFLKLRANYGEAGNFPTAFANERTIQFLGFLGQQASTFGQAGNEDLKPERTTTFEAGLDIGAWDNRLAFTINYYNSETEDALFIVPPAPSTGESSQLRNVGTIQNEGWEVSMRAILLRSKDWDFRVRASVNTLENEVTDAGGAAPFNINGFSSRTIQTVVAEGQPVGFLRGNFGTFDNEGVFESTEALAFLGSTLPDLFGNAGLSLRYKTLTLEVNADYSMGAFAHSFDRQFRFRYGVDNEGISQAEIDANGTNNWLNFSDQFVEGTNFFKVRLISLNYDLPESLFSSTINQISFGFSVVNPINVAESSFDPEATQAGSAQGQNGATTGGIAYGVVSLPREFIGSIQIRF